MNKIFLAHSFRDRNAQLVNELGRIIQSHGLVPVTGQILGGNALSPAVQERIKQCDALVALMTCEEKIEGQQAWRSTPWVRDEYGFARAREQRAIAIVEDGVEMDGAYAQHEYIKLDRAVASAAIVALSETIARWRAEAGRSLEIRLVPDEAATFASSDQAKCRYKLVSPDLPAPKDWKEGHVASKPGGVFLLVPGVKTEDTIRVQLLQGENPKWSSVEFPQWVHIQLASVQ